MNYNQQKMLDIIERCALLAFACALTWIFIEVIKRGLQ